MSLRSQCKQLLEESAYRVLVVDQHALRLINFCVTMSELLDEQITLVEPLEKRRAPYKTMPAIYLVTPSPATIQWIIEDFTRSKTNKDGHLYQEAHLFFLSALDDRLFYKLKASPASRFIKTLRELYMDFMAYESQVFTLGRPLSLITFFGTEITGEQATREYINVAKQLASFCITWNEFPIIRYSAQNGVDRVTSRLAGLVYEELDRYARLDSAFPGKESTMTGANRAQLLIVDRTVDVLAPLLHEFTYQAMANDVLPLLDDGTRYKYTYVSNTEGKKDKEVMLNEQLDPIWAAVRHIHIAECITYIINSFNKFLSDNRAATSSSSAKKDVKDLRELKELLSSVPQFQELKSKFSVHINIAQECMAVFNEKKLAQVGEIEQDLACGETASGEKPKKVEISMIPLLDDPKISSVDKVRLLMLYIIGKEGVKDEDRRMLLDHAHISPDEVNAITNLVLLGVKLSQGPKNKHMSKNKKERKKKKRDDDVSYDLSRYSPAVKNLAQDMIEGNLNKTEFPFVRDPNAPGSYGTFNFDREDANSTGVSPMSPVQGLSNTTPVRSGSNQPSGSGSNKAQPAESLRSTKPSWHNRGKASMDSSNLMNSSNASGGDTAFGAKADDKRKAGRIFIFVVGGLTYSEMRSVYELSQALKKDVYIGSTHIITPSKFVEDLKRMKEPIKEKELEDSSSSAGGIAKLSKSDVNASGDGGDGDEEKSKRSSLKRMLKGVFGSKK